MPPLEELERSVLLTEIKSLAESLVPALEIDQEPHMERTLFTIPHDKYDSRSVLFRDVFGHDIDSANCSNFIIDSTVNRLTNEASMQLRVNYSNGHVRLVQLDPYSIDPRQPRSDKPRLYDNDTDLGEISVKAVNWLLGSIVRRTKTDDYSPYDNMDVRDVVTMDRLIDALSEQSPDTGSIMSYILSDTLANTCSRIEFLKKDGEVKDVSVTSEHRYGATRIWIDLLQRKSMDSIDTSMFDADSIEQEMQEIDGIRVYSVNIDGESTAILSKIETLLMMRDFMSDVAQRLFAQNPSELPIHSEVVDDSSQINLEDSRFFQRNQNRFNPPNPCT